MNPGKNRCEYLKEIRKRIAKENDIPLEQRECTFKGECSGTCPFCEAELQYLEKELHKRRTLGKAVTVAGIALSSVVMSACFTSSQLPPTTVGDIDPKQVPTVESSDPLVQRADNEKHFTQLRGCATFDNSYVNVTSVGTTANMMAFYDVAAKFPAEFGSPMKWLSQRLRGYRFRIANSTTIHAASTKWTMSPLPQL